MTCLQGKAHTDAHRCRRRRRRRKRRRSRRRRFNVGQVPVFHNPHAVLASFLVLELSSQSISHCGLFEDGCTSCGRKSSKATATRDATAMKRFGQTNASPRLCLLANYTETLGHARAHGESAKTSFSERALFSGVQSAKRRCPRRCRRRRRTCGSRSAAPCPRGMQSSTFQLNVSTIYGICRVVSAPKWLRYRAKK